MPSDTQTRVSSISLHLTYSFKQYNHGLKYVAGSSDDTIDLCKRYFKSFTVITDPNKGMLNLLQAGILLFTVLRLYSEKGVAFRTWISRECCWDVGVL